jgi:hypothetical protein
MQEKIIPGSGEQIEESDLVEFRLLYEGELVASNNTKRRPAEKHAIRRVFHPQLRRLWNMNRNLRQLAMEECGKLKGDDPLLFKLKEGVEGQHYPIEQDYVDIGLNNIGRNWSRAGYELVPLVTPKMALRCSLDVLLLRPDEDKYIFTRGDIDGQLKTLFDALKIPENEEATGKSPPQEGETPFFCLLQDDSLITEVHVTTDQLLLLPNRKDIKAIDSFVLIDVKLNHRHARTFDNYFG